MLEHVGGDDDIERILAERLVHIEHVEVGDDHALGELLGDLRRLAVDLDAHDRAPLLLQHLGGGAGGAPELEDTFALADQPDDEAVCVVLDARIDGRVVDRRLVHRFGVKHWMVLEHRRVRVVRCGGSEHLRRLDGLASARVGSTSSIDLTVFS